MWNRLVLASVKKAPSREAVIKAIQQSSAKLTGPRRGWQVKAAAWVKKAHVDRGDKKVGLHSTTGFHIIEDLRPRYIVPDFTDCKLRPYVAHYKPTNKGSSASGQAAP